MFILLWIEVWWCEGEWGCKLTPSVVASNDHAMSLWFLCANKISSRRRWRKSTSSIWPDKKYSNATASDSEGKASNDDDDEGSQQCTESRREVATRAHLPAAVATQKKLFVRDGGGTRDRCDGRAGGGSRGRNNSDEDAVEGDVYCITISFLIKRSSLERIVYLFTNDRFTFTWISDVTVNPRWIYDVTWDLIPNKTESGTKNKTLIPTLWWKSCNGQSTKSWRIPQTFQWRLKKLTFKNVPENERFWSDMKCPHWKGKILLGK